MARKISRLNAADLDRRTLRLMRRARIPGLSLGLLGGGKRLFARGYGYRDREARLPATERTVYGIASMTKSFTALAILRLEEEGALRVTDPVSRHLPEFRTSDPRGTRRIALHHFLTHSSGLPPLPSIYYTSGRSIARDPPYDPKVARRAGVDPDHAPIDTYEEVMEYLAHERYRLLGLPGQYFSYSNEGFGLLAAVIERASGRTYESFLEEEVFRPAGMRSTTFDPGIMFRFPEVTTLYSPNWKRGKGPLVASQEWWEDTCLRAAGAIRSNVEDLLGYLELYLREGRVGRERIISPKSLRKMLRPHIEVRPGLYYGYGIAVRPDFHGTLLAFHDGGLKGVSSQFAVAPNAGVAGTVLANADLVPSYLALQYALDRLLGLDPKTPFIDTPPPGPKPRSLTEYGGWYCSGEGIWAKVRPRRDYLTLDFRGIELTERGLKLHPHGGDGFVLRRGGETGWLRFLRDSRGRVDAVHLGWRVVRKRDPRVLPRARLGRLEW
jgi:CubicO group peptidase (beta-lactamase class C family)